MSNLTTVLRTLPTLSPLELQQVRAKIGAALSLAGGSPPEVRIDTDRSDYLLEGIQVELRRRGLLGQHTFIGRQITTTYRTASASMREQLKEQVGNLTAAEYTALGQLAARALANYLERGKVPIGINTLLNNISKVLTALDQSYPGYLEAGLLSLCWRK